MSLRAATWIVAVACSASVACFHGAITGSFAATSGPGPDWHLMPDRCISGNHSGYLGADLYRDQKGDDTEIVVIKDGGGFRVLARIPDRGQMVVLTPDRCSRFDAEVHFNGVTVNDVQAVAGSVAIECTSPELGHVTGEASFVCY